LPDIRRETTFRDFVRRILAIALLMTAGIPALSSEPPLPLQTVADVPLSGGTTRLDYESYDPQSHRLFIAHLGDSLVSVFDTQTQKLVADIPEVGHVHGVLVVSELGRVYASATRTNEVVAIDGKTLTITARISGGVYPDGMAYAPDAHRLFVSDEVGTTETVIDTQTNQRIDTIHLWSTVGNTQYDPVSHHIFVNAQARNQLVEIDPARDEIIARHDLPGADGPHGLYIAADARLAFVACEGNNKLLVVDMKTMKVITSFEVGKDPDVLAFDPGLHRLYVAGEEGVASAFAVDNGTIRKIGEGFVGDDAHVVAVDPDTHRVYFPLEDINGHPALRIMKPR
jgi:DNA-binding beta-propeller fold protein YncE